MLDKLFASLTNSATVWVKIDHMILDQYINSCSLARSGVPWLLFHSIPNMRWRATAPFSVCLIRFKHKQQMFFSLWNMSNFVSEKVFLGGELFHYFNVKKNSAESHSILVKVYDKHTPAKSGLYWLGLEDEERWIKKIKTKKVFGMELSINSTSNGCKYLYKNGITFVARTLFPLALMYSISIFF